MNSLIPLLSLLILPVLMAGCESSNRSDLPKLKLAFADPAWDGKKIPEGQQCQRFGGKNPSTPKLLVDDIPDNADAIIMEFSDRNYSPMDAGGHGKIGFRIDKGTPKVTIPSIPGHSFDLPNGFFLVKAHQAPSWDKAGAYMPPCSGGRGNAYYVTVKAVNEIAEGYQDYNVLGMGRLELGKY